LLCLICGWRRGRGLPEAGGAKARDLVLIAGLTCAVLTGFAVSDLRLAPRARPSGEGMVKARDLVLIADLRMRS
jgi:hypothetical protein